MGIALDRLVETGWGKELEITQISGTKYAYPFTDEYEVTFKIKDEKPWFEPPKEIWIELLTIRVRRLD